jgi:hypothetical protein
MTGALETQALGTLRPEMGAGTGGGDRARTQFAFMFGWGIISRIRIVGGYNIGCILNPDGCSIRRPDSRVLKLPPKSV